jgi:hypothetical protein
MKIKTEIEIPGDYIDVIFEGFPTWEDQSYDDEYGNIAIAPYSICETITWNKTKFNPAQNKAIERYLEKYSESIEQLICEAFEKESKNN